MVNTVDTEVAVVAQHDLVASLEGRDALDLVVREEAEPGVERAEQPVDVEEQLVRPSKPLLIRIKAVNEIDAGGGAEPARGARCRLAW